MQKSIKKNVDNSLTLRQRQLYDFIVNRENWRPPSFSQIMKFMGYQSKNAVTMKIKAIEKKGYEIPKIPQ